MELQRNYTRNFGNTSSNKCNFGNTSLNKCNFGNTKCLNFSFMNFANIHILLQQQC
ncbi:hypothetical protein C2G38_2069041 [Gigaspora rosea]|uniref:Uncharacterized protein n=1 Tax=Gigaspora rosea TaxID=44941 RepID=A0A397VQM9_9GLOM|nr:hypothetical protein C2G38_2069041 [Gigaspora rosea]